MAKPSAKEKSGSAAPQTPHRPKQFCLSLLLKQLLVAAGVAMLIYFAYEGSTTYRWVYSSLLSGNYEILTKYPHATHEQRLEMKLGAMVPYLNHIKKHTPDSAVILFPAPQDECFGKTEQEFDLKQLNLNTLLSYGYARFLWPRRCVTENRKGQTPFYDQITHVAIVNGWGYQHLDYTVEKPHYLGIYPKHKK